MPVMASPTATYSTSASSSPRRNSLELDRAPKKSPIMRSNEAKVSKYTKAWTLEEERILLQSRVERIPYKQIAACLGKTDLACRLHYHQMVMAKRTPQTQPGRSIVFLSSEHPPEIHRLAPSISNSSSPSIAHEGFIPPVDSRGEANDGYLVVPIANSHRRANSVPQRRLEEPIELHRRQTTPLPGQSLHRRPTASSVDLSRLQHLYKEHAAGFWANIAAAYSQEDHLTPTDLESAFLAANNAPSHPLPVRKPVPYQLPRPEASASTLGNVHTSPRNGSSSPEHHRLQRSPHPSSQGSRCSVESLLNHASRDAMT